MLFSFNPLHWLLLFLYPLFALILTSFIHPFHWVGPVWTNRKSFLSITECSFLLLFILSKYNFTCRITCKENVAHKNKNLKKNKKWINTQTGPKIQLSYIYRHISFHDNSALICASYREAFSVPTCCRENVRTIMFDIFQATPVCACALERLV